MWNPQREKLASPQTWIAAAGQIFFSLSVGFGVIINYASYLSKKDDVVLSGLTACSMNELFEVCLGGLITLPAAFIFLGATAATFGTFDLGFNALPAVFEQMPAGRWFGFLWFFMLFLAAITSSLSMLQPVLAFFEEGLGLKRPSATGFLAFSTIIGSGFILYHSKGNSVLDTFDFWVGTLLIYLLALAQAILYGWIFGIERGSREASVGASLKLPKVAQYSLKYVAPIYLIVLFGFFCYEKLPSRVLALDNKAAETESAWGKFIFPKDGVVWIGVNSDTIPPEFGQPAKDGKWADASGYKYLGGQVESVRANRSIGLSFVFFCIILVALLVMIGMAGRRWEREGRYDALE